MMELFNKQGKIKKFLSDACIELVEGGLYSLYGGIDLQFKEHDVVRFTFKKKDKDGKIYNNIVDGSMELVDSPKDITEQYSQGSQVMLPRHPDKDTLIVRQSCLKAAVEIIGKFAFEEGKKITSEEITNLAEEFESWVFRDG